MDYGIRGKAALVTGAAGGIGSATALAFARAGVDVALFDRNAEGVEHVAQQVREAGVRAIAGAFDVRQFEAWEQAIARAEAELGGLDFIVNVAGGGSRQTLATMTPQDWHAIIDLNLTGPFHSIKAGAPALRRRGGGAIVTVASQLAFAGGRGNAAYVASKGAVVSLTRSIALSLLCAMSA